MRAGINREHTKELSKVLSQMKVPQKTIDQLLSSANAANTYRAYLLKKKITSVDNWTIHFGARWAKPANTTEINIEEKRGTVIKHSVSTSESENRNLASVEMSFSPTSTVDKSPYHVQEASFQKPATQKYVVDIETEQFEKLTKIANEKSVPINLVVSLALRKYLS